MSSGRRSRRFPRPFGADLFRPPAGRMVMSTWRSWKLSTVQPKLVFPRQSNSTATGKRRAGLFLGFQQMGVVVQEGFDFILHAEDFYPLFFVKGDGEPAHAVERYGSLLTHFQTQSTDTLGFELIVFRAQLLNLCPQIFVGHGATSSSETRLDQSRLISLLLRR